MTGLHLGHCPIRGNTKIKWGQKPLPKSYKTVADYFKTAGYATAAIGKWGLGNRDNEGAPRKHGFDSFAGYYCQYAAQHYYPGDIWLDGKPHKLGEAGTMAGYSHYFFTREAVDFISEHKKGPFFLYLAYTIPHAPLVIPKDEPCYKMYKGQHWPEKMKIHAGMISLLDKDVGKILDLLKKLGISKRTLVLFTSDNGAHKEGGAEPAFFKSCGPLRGIKRDMYEGGVRVPFIAYWPGVVKPGVSDVVLTHWDFLPTACELSGLKPPKGIDGVSYVSLLKGVNVKRTYHDCVYFELHRPDRRGLRKGDWVIVQQKVAGNEADSGVFELFNLKKDLGERKNLASKYPEKLQEMKTLLIKSRSPNKAFKFQWERGGRRK
jgi:arylsulfatase A-like enzyme